MSVLHQLYTIVAHGLAAEFAQRERVISPCLFACALVVILELAFHDLSVLDPELPLRLAVAEALIALVVALQVSLLKIFAVDDEDKAFLILSSNKLNPVAWYGGKCITALVMASLITTTTLSVSLFFSGGGLWGGLSLSQVPSLILLLFGALVGLTALGVLVSACTLRGKGRELLFPLIFYPLCVPVLLATSQGSLELLSGGLGFGSWLGLLLGFDMIYLLLGFLLFEHLVIDL